MNSYLMNLLEEKNITQAELARRMGKTRGDIFRYTHNVFTTIPIETALDMSIALDIPVDALVRGLIDGKNKSV